MKVSMGDSVQLNDVEGCYQNYTQDRMYETIDPIYVEEVDFTPDCPPSQARTSTDRYQDEPKPKISNSPNSWQIKFMFCLLLLIILISTSTLSVFIHILMNRLDDKADKEVDSSIIVNGGWETWSPWSSCTRSCNGGERKRNRSCSNLYSLGLGRRCFGNSEEMSICNGQPCPARQIGFSVSGNTMVDRTLTFDFLRTNYGDCYSTTTGKFTCSYSGLYFFALSLIKERANHSIADLASCYIYKNGIPQMFTETDPRDDETDNGSYETSAFIVVHLNQGDTVYAGSCSKQSSINKHSSFSGFLLQSD